MAVVTQWVNCAAVENPNSSQTCRQRRQSTAVFRINSGADALAPAQRAPRPPGRPVELWKDLILREKSGTGASRADQGVRPTKSMQDPAYGKTMRHWPERLPHKARLVTRTRDRTPGRVRSRTMAFRMHAFNNVPAR